jgi:hypothetical protein
MNYKSNSLCISLTVDCQVQCDSTKESLVDHLCILVLLENMFVMMTCIQRDIGVEPNCEMTLQYCISGPSMVKWNIISG